MPLTHDTRSDGAPLVELDPYTDRVLTEAVERLAPQYDDLDELQAAVLAELHGVEGFDEGEAELICAAVDAIAPELVRGPEYFARLAREDAARPAWPPRLPTQAELFQIAAAQREYTVALRALLWPEGVA